LNALNPPQARQKADALVRLSAPRGREAHLFNSGGGSHVFLPDRSRIYDLGPAACARLESARGTEDFAAQLSALGLAAEAPAFAHSAPPAVRAVSLAIAQTCNLGCVYCYARQGDFGAPPKSMSLEVAKAAVDLALRGAGPGERAQVTFLGGEPLANRAALREATEYASREAARVGAEVGFSITTNGTLLTQDDGDFFEAHGFAVTISLDGTREAHDRQRPFKNGRGSYDAIMKRVAPLLARQRRMQVSARVTVTPANLDLRTALAELIGLGFHSVGFSPALHAPDGSGEMRRQDLIDMLAAMVACGEDCERRLVRGERYPFANLLLALGEIHRGSHRPYPCGAGAGYVGISADGEVAACHRFVGDAAGALGSLATGLDDGLRAQWLADHHVHRQTPCGDCWARYLCGGGCHHETIHGGRPACDYIRGWLHYCLGAYVRLSTVRRELFESNPRSLQ
jgi:uncharacterized protein